MTDKTIRRAMMTATKNLKRFAEGSHAVDEKGQPLRLYHGTADDVQYFSTTHPNRKDAGWLGEGVYLTKSPEIASWYAKAKRGNAAPNVMPLHVRLTNPYYAEDRDKQRLRYIEATQGREAAQQASAEWTAMLKKHGFDGVIHVGPREDAVEYVVFDPRNVKSATGNSGAYDTSTDDITKAKGGAVDKTIRRATMIARDHEALLRRVANIYPGPGGGMDPSPGGGGYAGPGGGKYIGPSRYAKGGEVPPFKLHSGAAKLIAQKGQAKATPQQYAAMPGIKPDELKYAKFDTLGNKAVPKEQVLEHLEGNTVPLQETVYTGKDDRSALARYHSPRQSIALPGGENYREVLLHTPIKELPASSELQAARERLKQANAAHDDALLDQLSDRPRLSDAEYERADREAALANRELERLTLAHHSANERENFQSSHWHDVPNVVAHIRMHDRKGPNGENVLHVEELQSDWGQQGRERGFNGPRKADMVVQPIGGGRWEIYNRGHGRTAVSFEGDEGIFNTRAEAEAALPHFQDDPYEHTEGVPHGPYVDNTQKWTDLALKRVLHEAAHGGYDKVVFTPGDEQNKRYSLEKHIKHLDYHPEEKYLHATTHDGRGIEHENVKPEDLPGIVGKDVAARLLQQPLEDDESRMGPRHRLSAEGLTMGGLGMRGYYDNIMPKRLQALAQQHDPKAKVQLGGHRLPPKKKLEGYETEPGDVLEHMGIPPLDWSVRWPAMSDEEKAQAHAAYENSGPALHSLDVTPQMRDSIKQNGFSQFRRGGPVDENRSLLEHAAKTANRPHEELVRALMQSGPREPVKQGISSQRRPDLIERAMAIISPNRRIAVQPSENITPEDLFRKKAVLVGGMSDRSGAGYDVGGVDDVRFDEPISALGGVDYNRMPHTLKNKLGWASARNAITGLANAGRKAAEASGAGSVILTPKLMGLQALDQSPMMMKGAVNLLRAAKVSKADEKAFNEYVRSMKPSADKEEHMPDFPGIKHPKLYDYLMKQKMPDRTALIKAMDVGAWNKKGIPNPASLRMAFTKPELMRAPVGTPGAMFTTLDVDRPHHEDVEHGHPSYEIGMRGQRVGNFDRPIPKEAVFQSYFEDPRNAGRRPVDLTNAYMKKPVTQVVDQRWLDKIMPIWEKTQPGWKKGGLVNRALKIARKVK